MTGDITATVEEAVEGVGGVWATVGEKEFDVGVGGERRKEGL